MSYYVKLNVGLSMAIEVDADSYTEAERMVMDAWEGNEAFMGNYLREAAIDREEIHSGTPADYGMTLDELCEQ